jgi:hypothetical protein
MVMKEKSSERGGYRHLWVFRHGREPHILWRFLAQLLLAYCDHRPYCRCRVAWMLAWRDARFFFRPGPIRRGPEP